MRTCDKCVPAEEHDKLQRQWNRMCWLCVVLMALVAGLGVLAMEWRKDLSETRQALDRANGSLMDKSYPVYVKPVRRVK